MPKSVFQILFKTSALFFVALPGFSQTIQSGAASPGQQTNKEQTLNETSAPIENPNSGNRLYRPVQKNTKPTANKEASKTQGSDFQNRAGGQQGSNKPYGHTITEIQNQGTHENLENQKAGGNQKAILMTDPEILSVLETLHSTEVKTGNLAAEKGQNDSVQHMGNQSEKDHGDLKLAVTNIQKKANIKPKENPVAQNLLKMGNESLAKLEKLNDKKFDLAYLEHEIKFHQEALRLLDSQLLPNAKNKDIQTILKKSRITLLNHLQHSEYTLNSIRYPR